MKNDKIINDLYNKKVEMDTEMAIKNETKCAINNHGYRNGNLKDELKNEKESNDKTIFKILRKAIVMIIF